MTKAAPRPRRVTASASSRSRSRRRRSTSCAPACPRRRQPRAPSRRSIAWRATRASSSSTATVAAPRCSTRRRWPGPCPSLVRRRLGLGRGSNLVLGHEVANCCIGSARRRRRGGLDGRWPMGTTARPSSSLGRLTLLGAAAVALATAPARAAVPTAYKGLPYLGKATPIPGRVEPANLDTGGEGVVQGRRRSPARERRRRGLLPISGDDHRPTGEDLQHLQDERSEPRHACRRYSSDDDDDDDDEVLVLHGLRARALTVRHRRRQAGRHVQRELLVGLLQRELGLAVQRRQDMTLLLDGVNKSGKVVMPGTSDYHKWKTIRTSPRCRPTCACR